MNVASCRLRTGTLSERVCRTIPAPHLLHRQPTARGAPFPRTHAGQAIGRALGSGSASPGGASRSLDALATVQKQAVSLLLLPSLYLGVLRVSIALLDIVRVGALGSIGALLQLAAGWVLKPRADGSGASDDDSDELVSSTAPAVSDQVSESGAMLPDGLRGALLGDSDGDDLLSMLLDCADGAGNALTSVQIFLEGLLDFFELTDGGALARRIMLCAPLLLILFGRAHTLSAGTGPSASGSGSGSGSGSAGAGGCGSAGIAAVAASPGSAGSSGCGSGSGSAGATAASPGGPGGGEQAPGASFSATSVSGAGGGSNSGSGNGSGNGGGSGSSGTAAASPGGGVQAAGASFSATSVSGAGGGSNSGSGSGSSGTAAAPPLPAGDVHAERASASAASASGAGGSGGGCCDQAASTHSAGTTGSPQPHAQSQPQPQPQPQPHPPPPPPPSLLASAAAFVASLASSAATPLGLWRTTAPCLALARASTALACVAAMGHESLALPFLPPWLMLATTGVSVLEVAACVRALQYAWQRRPSPPPVLLLLLLLAARAIVELAVVATSSESLRSTFGGLLGVPGSELPLAALQPPGIRVATLLASAGVAAALLLARPSLLAAVL